MATSLLYTAVFSSFSWSNFSSFTNKLGFSTRCPSSLSILRAPLRGSQQSTTIKKFIAFAAPEVLKSQEDAPESFEDEESETSAIYTSADPEQDDELETSAFSISANPEQMAPKHKIRIKLRSYWVPLIEDSCKQIMEAARTTNAKTMGPVPLPTKKRVYCVLKSPHVNKDARFHFEIRTHQRLIDILYPTAQTIDSLMHLDLPDGVDVQVKL